METSGGHAAVGARHRADAWDEIPPLTSRTWHRTPSSKVTGCVYIALCVFMIAGVLASAGDAGLCSRLALSWFFSCCCGNRFV